MYKPSLLDKLDRKYHRFAIPKLMNYLVVCMAVVFLMDMFTSPSTGFSLTSLLTFSRSAILNGQVWRVITFILIPPNSSPLFIVFALYFYWLMGSSLEEQWGAFRFNVFYFTGVIGTILGGFITGYATNQYLNMALFLAFAILYPNFEVRLFFILPIKVKWLALVDLISMLLMLILVTWSGKIAILISFANVLLFFWRPFITSIKNAYRRYKWKKDNRR